MHWKRNFHTQENVKKWTKKRIWKVTVIKQVKVTVELPTVQVKVLDYFVAGYMIKYDNAKNFKVIS